MHTLPRTPFVGRQNEVRALLSALDAAAEQRGGVHILAGESGIGKTRLLETVLQRARERDFQCVVGRAFPVEAGIPFAVFGDGFVPVLRDVAPERLQTLTRGALAELGVLFPTLRLEGGTGRLGESSDLRPRLFDTFAQLLYRLAARKPMVVVLENLQWADPSSLDLFHFIARSVAGHPVLVLASYNDAQRDANRSLRLAEQSLMSLGVLTRHVLPPLSQDDVTDLVARLFEEPLAVVQPLADRVYHRTRGNAFFVEETLKELVRAGRLRRDGERWVGWTTQQLALPDSIRDVLSLRYERLSRPAQEIVQMAAAVGVQVPHGLLARLSRLDDAALLAAVEELLAERIFIEVEVVGGPAYAFAHPMMQDMLYAELSQARRHVLHALIADALEAHYGAEALAHAPEIAVHVLRSDTPQQADRAITYLAAAGRLTLERGAAHEAAEVLAAARERVERDPAHPLREEVLVLFGRARHRLGDYPRAAEAWQRARDLAAARNAHERVAVHERRLGIAAMRVGDVVDALAHLERGRDAATRAGAEGIEAELHLARASVLLETGHGDAALVATREALAIAERLGAPRLLGQVHLALQALAVWRGPSVDAVGHGEQALAFARASDDLRTAWQAEWVLSYHAGLTGNAKATEQHVAAAYRLADQLRSPVLRLWTAEVEVEYRSAIGEWDDALGIADRTIEEARAFGQKLLLPRLLVWSALVHCGRGDFAAAKARIDEAWQLSGADRVHEGGPVNVHTVVPAHVGLAYYHLYRKDFRTALEVGERGLAIADRTGYEVWAVHRLLPLAAEACLWLRDWDGATAYGERLREASQRLGHPLAGAWAEACTALMRMLQGDHSGALAQLRHAADALDAIPFTEHAARLRRKLADALLSAGDEDGCAAELRRIHDVFRRLGATLALQDVRERLRELDRPLPPRQPSMGAVLEALTPTETEVARQAMKGLKNAEIAKVLGMASRTVGTHLRNIYKKFNVAGRVALTNRLRDLGL